MKTSLVCLLLLAAVACAAPKAGQAPQMAKKAPEAEKAREAKVAAGAELETKAGVQREAGSERGYPACYGACYAEYTGEIGCLFDGCYYDYDVIGYTYNPPCECCAVAGIYYPDDCYHYY